MSDKDREAFERVRQRMKDAEPYREIWSDEFKVIEALQAALSQSAEKDAEIERLKAMLEAVKAGQRDHADVSRRRGDEIARLQRVVDEQAAWINKHAPKFNPDMLPTHIDLKRGVGLTLIETAEKEPK
jgi:hypothetical protein